MCINDKKHFLYIVLSDYETLLKEFPQSKSIPKEIKRLKKEIILHEKEINGIK